MFKKSINQVFIWAMGFAAGRLSLSDTKEKDLEHLHETPEKDNRAQIFDK